MTRAGTHLSGIVLAGGAGRRVGGPKAHLRLGELTLVQHAAAMLAATCDEVVVVTRPEVPVQVEGARVVYDRPGPDAPLTGIATGLAAASAEEVVVLACDLPFAAAAVGALVRAPAGRPVIATADGRAQPLCARYPRRVALQAADLLLGAGERRAFALAAALGAAHLPVPASAVLNVNGTDDLRRARIAHALLHRTRQPVSSVALTTPPRLPATALAEGAP